MADEQSNGHLSAVDELFTLVEPVTEAVDLGEYNGAWKGHKLTVILNLPGTLELTGANETRVVTNTFDKDGNLTQSITRYEAGQTETDLVRYRKVVVYVYPELKARGLEQVSKLPDSAVAYLHGQFWKLYNAHHETMRKNSISG